MPTYIERKILDRSPFETIDSPASVGWSGWRHGWVAKSIPA
jgi:hypothetical protein